MKLDTIEIRELRNRGLDPGLSTGPSFPIECEPPSADDGAMRFDEGPDVIGGVFGDATPVIAAAVPQTTRRREEQTRLLRQAGYLARSAYIDFAAIRYAMTICSILVLGTLLLIVSSEWEPFVLGGLVTIPFLLWLIPASIVERQAERRNEEIARGVPDFMSLIRLSVQQGLDVPTAFTKAGAELHETYPAIAVETALVGVHTEVSDFVNALRGFRDRVAVPEIDTLTSMLIQSTELGSGVIESLEKNSRSLRQLQSEKRTTRAKWTPWKIMVPALFFLLPAALLVFFAPAIVERLAELDAAIVNSNFGR